MEIAATPYSNLKVFKHSQQLEAIAAGTHIAPIYIRIKPTNYCNHHCFYCSYADSDLALRDGVNYTDSIPYEKMMQIIEDIAKMEVKAVTFSGGGEPLIYPHIIEAMKKLLAAKVDLSIITNGQLLTEERAEILTQAKWVRISCDSADAATYAKVRKLDSKALSEVCTNISRFSKMKNRDCELGINFVINHENAGQVYQMAKLSKELGVNHIKFTPRILKDLFQYHALFKESVIDQLHRAAELEEDNFKVINKYESDFETSMLNQRSYEHCYVNRLVTVIAADSKVYFCHDNAYVSEGQVGDLEKQSFKDFWFSEKTEKLYRNFNPKEKCNHHCIYDDRNILLNTYYDLDKSQINFI